MSQWPLKRDQIPKYILTYRKDVVCLYARYPNTTYFTTTPDGRIEPFDNTNSVQCQPERRTMKKFIKR